LGSKNKPRRRVSLLSTLGVTYLQRHSPAMVAWWSAAYPGLGHLLLQQNLRGVFLTLCEVIFNTLSHLNEGIVYSFSGRFEMAKQVVNPNWAFGYIMIYLFSIYDSYRSTKEMNKLGHLAQLENSRITPFALKSMEIQYLEIKNPMSAVLSSIFMPGLGQLYNHRVCLGVYIIFWWSIFAGFSCTCESMLKLLYSNIRASTAVLNPHWLLFMPSLLWGAVYQAYMGAIEQNRLFRMEQRQYLAERYGNSDISLIPE
jgi:TM2 domain-containing membrane protein YozV